MFKHKHISLALYVALYAALYLVKQNNRIFFLGVTTMEHNINLFCAIFNYKTVTIKRNHYYTNIFVYGMSLLYNFNHVT